MKLDQKQKSRNPEEVAVFPVYRVTYKPTSQSTFKAMCYRRDAKLLLWFVLLGRLTGNTGILFWELKGILETVIPT